jgi:hypothetical protein
MSFIESAKYLFGAFLENLNYKNPLYGNKKKTKMQKKVTLNKQNLPSVAI